MNHAEITKEEFEALPEVELLIEVAPVLDDDARLAQHRAQWIFGRRRLPRTLMIAAVLTLLGGGAVMAVSQEPTTGGRPALIEAPTVDLPTAPLPAAEQPAVVIVEHQVSPLPATDSPVLLEPAAPAGPRGKVRRPRRRSRDELRRQVREIMGVTDLPAPAVQAPALRVRRRRQINTPQFLASRIYRRNRRSLLACDELARRRGETLNNSRALFLVEAQRGGAGSVAVSGKGLSPRRLSCYRIMAARWRLPRTAMGYRAKFQHVN